jgi:hypothetical protein
MESQRPILIRQRSSDNNHALATQCRQAFAAFFQKAGIQKRPRVVACGGRSQAIDRFNRAMKSGESPFLLIDSEGPPPAMPDANTHYIVQAMEAWFHADRTALPGILRQCFKASALSGRPNVEEIPKGDLFEGLKCATRDCQKGEYSKGKHSFHILASIDPSKVRSISPHAERLLTTLATFK